ncbi:MAG: hypothetical protein ACJ8DI_01555, partial [Ktedonobacteraceae bacterium]
WCALSGLYGNAAPLTDVLASGLGVIARSKDYALLDLPEVKAVLAHPPEAQRTHPESETYRALYDCLDIALTPTGPRVRLIVATHAASSTSASIGKQRDGLVYELFVTHLPAPAFSPQDVLDLYLHRGSFETVLADEDEEQDPALVFLYPFWTGILAEHQRVRCGISVWNAASSSLPPPCASLTLPRRTFPNQHLQPHLPPEAQAAFPVVYGPAQWARTSFTGGFPGSAFTPQPDGTLLCPANHPLYAQERRPQRDGSYRVLYAARIGDCAAMRHTLCVSRKQRQHETTSGQCRFLANHPSSSGFLRTRFPVA